MSSVATAVPPDSLARRNGARRSAHWLLGLGVAMYAAGIVPARVKMHEVFGCDRVPARGWYVLESLLLASIVVYFAGLVAFAVAHRTAPREEHDSPVRWVRLGRGALLVVPLAMIAGIVFGLTGSYACFA